MRVVELSARVIGRCYACDAKVVGVRDRRPEGGEVEMACARHADPTIAVRAVCMYCGMSVRRGSITIDTEHAHRACHVDACRDYPRRSPRF